MTYRIAIGFKPEHDNQILEYHLNNPNSTLERRTLIIMTNDAEEMLEELDEVEEVLGEDPLVCCRWVNISQQ